VTNGRCRAPDSAKTRQRQRTSRTLRKSETSLSVINRRHLRHRAREVLCLAASTGSARAALAGVMRLLPQTARIGGAISIGRTRECYALEQARPEAPARRRKSRISSRRTMTALDSVFRSGQQIGESLIAQRGMSARAARARAAELGWGCRLPSRGPPARSYPERALRRRRQRAMIALALALDPKLLLATSRPRRSPQPCRSRCCCCCAERASEMAHGEKFVVTQDTASRARSPTYRRDVTGRLVELGDVVDVMGTPKHPYTRG